MIATLERVIARGKAELRELHGRAVAVPARLLEDGLNVPGERNLAIRGGRANHRPEDQDRAI
jgi:hypothetical protein